MTVDEQNWYVLRVRPRHERAVEERLSGKYEVFLPQIRKESQWSDRVKIIERPLFPGYLFIKTNIKSKYYILEENGVISFVEFKKKPAVIRNNEIDSIRILLKNTQSLIVDNVRIFSVGEKVRVTKGIFYGLNGYVQQLKNKLRLFVSIEQLGKSISVEVNKDSLEKVTS